MQSYQLETVNSLLRGNLDIGWLLPHDCSMTPTSEMTKRCISAMALT